MPEASPRAEWPRRHSRQHNWHHLQILERISSLIDRLSTYWDLVNSIMSRTHHYWYITRGVSTGHDLLTADIDVVFTFKFSYAKFLGGRCLETFQFLYCCNKPIWCKEKICYVIMKTRSGTNQSIEFRRRGAQEWRCTGVRRTWHVTHTLTSPDVPTHTHTMELYNTG